MERSWFWILLNVLFFKKYEYSFIKLVYYKFRGNRILDNSLLWFCIEWFVRIICIFLKKKRKFDKGNER